MQIWIWTEVIPSSDACLVTPRRSVDGRARSRMDMDEPPWFVCGNLLTSILPPKKNVFFEVFVHVLVHCWTFSRNCYSWEHHEFPSRTRFCIPLVHVHHADDGGFTSGTKYSTKLVTANPASRLIHGRKSDALYRRLNRPLKMLVDRSRTHLLLEISACLRRYIVLSSSRCDLSGEKTPRTSESSICRYGCWYQFVVLIIL